MIVLPIRDRIHFKSHLCGIRLTDLFEKPSERRDDPGNAFAGKGQVSIEDDLPEIPPVVLNPVLDLIFIEAKAL